MLSADVIVGVSGGRAPRSETDALTIGGMRFDVICTEPGGLHRLQEPGNCPPFLIGDALEVRFVQLPGGRYRLAPLQILCLRRAAEALAGSGPGCDTGTWMTG